jgi:hypothetical protein
MRHDCQKMVSNTRMRGKKSSVVFEIAAKNRQKSVFSPTASWHAVCF